MQSLKKIHAWAQMQVPLYHFSNKSIRKTEYSNLSLYSIFMSFDSESF